MSFAPGFVANPIPGRNISTWRWPFALAAPFLLVTIVLLTTGKTLPVFWGGDEPHVHWYLSRLFARDLPHFNPDYPRSATAPLFQLIGAGLIRLFGAHLELARCVNTAVDLLGIIALYRILHRVLRNSPETAALLASVVLFSCYFFGYAFRWLTDDFALCMCIFALGNLLRFADPAEAHRARDFFLGCSWCAITILTRQTYLFLWLPFGMTLLLSDLPAKSKALGLVGLTIALVPFGCLALAWGGLTPPAMHSRFADGAMHLYPMALPLMLLGFYAPFFYGPQLWRQRHAVKQRDFVLPALAAAIGLALVWKFPLTPIKDRTDLLPYFPMIARADIPGYFAGWLYAIASHLPKLHGNSVLFWILLPAGLASSASLMPEAVLQKDDPLRRISALFLLGLLLASMLNSISAQKYYDASILLFFVLHSRGEVARDALRRSALGALTLLFLVYFSIFTMTGVQSVDKTESDELPPALSR